MSEEKDIGIIILKDFMELSDIDIRKEVKDLVGGDQRWNSLLTKKGYISRTIYREKPYQILIEFYDKIIIDKEGIRWVEECGRAKATLIDFNKKYKPCHCGDGSVWVEGDFFGTFAPESYQTECSDCKGSMYVEKDTEE